MVADVAVRLVAAAALVVAAACAGATDEAPPTPSSVSVSPSPPPAPLPEPSAPPPDEGNLRKAHVRLNRVATLQQPLAMAVRADGSALYVAQKTGEVVILRGGRGPRQVLDLSGEVSQGREQGLLGLAFSPDGDFLYVNLSDENGDTRVVEFAMRGVGPDPGSRREVLAVDQPFGNHNGGNLAFGTDGYLYIGLGDGGSAGDPDGNAQSLQSLLGKMLRIDPRPGRERPYRIPRDNPFVGRAPARPEIWSYGLRNPWRYSFDRETGDLWIGDVGQSSREEIDFQDAASAGGENYGWDRLEGTLPFEGKAPRRAVPPIFEYGRVQGRTVIGGYVYRGSGIPDLRGAYVFGDAFVPELMALKQEDGELIEMRGLGVAVESLSSFGEDQAGELYAMSLSGRVFRLVSAA
jgi:glucose/arabinose dehydrogenase